MEYRVTLVLRKFASDGIPRRRDCPFGKAYTDDVVEVDVTVGRATIFGLVTSEVGDHMKRIKRLTLGGSIAVRRV